MVNATAVQCPCDKAAEVPRGCCADLFHRRVNYRKDPLVILGDDEKTTERRLRSVKKKSIKRHSFYSLCKVLATLMAVELKQCTGCWISTAADQVLSH